MKAICAKIAYALTDRQFALVLASMLPPNTKYETAMVALDAADEEEFAVAVKLAEGSGRIPAKRAPRLNL
jgi:hypothetical protein